MKRLIHSSLAIVCLAGLLMTLTQIPEPPRMQVIVYGESDTGFSWTRTYTGTENRLDGVVSTLKDSYLRLAESMDAGSKMKIFIDGTLVAEERHLGVAKAAFSGVQMSVHDQFAHSFQFTTQDTPPGFLADMEEPVEPFVCGGEEKETDNLDAGSINEQSSL